MKDMLTIVYDALLEDKDIAEIVTAERISYYVYPEGKDDSKALIIIKPLHPPCLSTGASNQALTTIHTFQIDVQSPNRTEVKLIQQCISNVMLYLGFSRLPEGLDEYLEDVRRYVDARRYRINTKLYDTNY